MGLAKTASVAIIGTDAHLVDVEVHVGNGVPGFSMVGLPTRSVKEAEQRTRPALLSVGCHWPTTRIVANLAPASLRKDGTHFDLALALGLLAATDMIPTDALEGWVTIGELALDGHVRSVRGILSAGITCRDRSVKGLICPAGNAAEASLVEGLRVMPVGSLAECLELIMGRWTPDPIEAMPPMEDPIAEDISEVRGHRIAKRALEIAAAGGHNLLSIETLDGFSPSPHRQVGPYRGADATLMECQGNEGLTAASTRGGDLGASEPQAPPQSPTPMPIHLSAAPGRACSVIRDFSPRTCTTGHSTPGARKGETCLVTGGRYANGGLARLAHPLRLSWLCLPRRVQRPAEGRVKWQPQIR